MSEPRRSTRARAREDAAPPAPETPKETPVKGAKSTLKRKRASTVAKEATPSTPVGESTPLAPKQTLPLRIVDGAPLPTLPEPQPLDLPANEWQNIQQSGVLEASFERSRAVWISGTNFRTFHKHFVQPKKVSERTEEDKAKFQRQKELTRNFPQIGGDNVVAQLVIEPHTFPIRLYGPREPLKSIPKKPAPTYGSWPNHSQHSQHSQHNQHGQPNQYTQYNSGHQPYQQPQPRPPPPKPAPKPPPPAPVSSPAPDPVIHMLAARAGTDPELKAVMKIVANGTASKEQLEFFQTHINELTQILAKQKADAARAKAAAAQLPAPKPVQPSPTPKPAATPTPPLQKPTPSPAPMANPTPPPPQTYKAPTPAPPSAPPAHTPKPTQTPAPAPAPVYTPVSMPAPPSKPIAAPTPPPPRPVQPVQQHQYPHPQHPPQPYPLAPTHPQTSYAPTPQQHRPSYTNNYPPPHQYQQPQQFAYNNPPPKTSYRPLVFEFQEGNNDKFYLPSYSFMEWLPNGSGVKISFLVTKLKPKPETFVIPPSTPTPKPPPTSAPMQTPVPALAPAGPSGSTNHVPPSASVNAAPTPIQPATPVTPAPHVPPTRIEDFDERKDMDDIEFYQPVTMLLLTDNSDIKSALPRAVRPPDVVEKYMEEIFDKCKRADETYLAFRLPKDGDDVVPEKRARSGDGTPMVATALSDSLVPGSALKEVLEKKRAGRPRKSLA